MVSAAAPLRLIGRLKEAACCAAANAATTPVFVACFNDYIVRELGYKTERRYYLLGGFPGFRWHYPENGNRARSDWCVPTLTQRGRGGSVRRHLRVAARRHQRQPVHAGPRAQRLL